MKKSFTFFVNHLISNKLFVVILTLLVTVGLAVSGYFAKDIETHYSLKQFQPDDHADIKKSEKVRQKFLISELTPFIVSLTLPEGRSWEDKEELETLHQSVERLSESEHIDTVVSLTNVPIAVVSEDTFSVATLRDMTGPKSVKGDPLLTPHLMSQDGQHTAVVVTPLSEDSESNQNIFAGIQNELSLLKGSVTAQIGGPSAITTQMTALLGQELVLFTALALLLTGAVLFILFRGFVAPALCVSLVLVSICFSMGLMSAFEIPFTVLSNTVPILIAITIIAMVSHSFIKYCELCKNLQTLEFSKSERVRQTFLHLAGPHLLTALTTAIGFGTLIPSDVPVIRDFGLSVVVSITLTCLLCLLLLPICFQWLPLPKKRFDKIQSQRLYSWVYAFRKPILLAFALMLVSLPFSLKNLNWSSLLLDDLPTGNSAKQASQFVDKNLGGTLPLDITIVDNSKSGLQPWREPAQLLKLDQFTKALRGFSAVGSVMGLADFLKASEANFTVPKTSQRVAEKYLLYGMSAKNPLDPYITPNKKCTRLSLRMRDVPSSEMLGTIAEFKQLGKRFFPEYQVMITGAAYSTHTINRELSERLMFGFFVALAWIYLLLAFIFKSFVWAGIAVIPNLMPPAILLAALCLSETPIEPSIAIIFSISLGIAFDNTVYLLNSLKAALKSQPSPLLALQTALESEFEACLLSGLCLMAGFSVFMFSHFAMNQTFGVFMLLSIVSGLVGDLVVLPAFVRNFPYLLGQEEPLQEQPETRKVLPHAA